MPYSKEQIELTTKHIVKDVFENQSNRMKSSLQNALIVRINHCLVENPREAKLVIDSKNPTLFRDFFNALKINEISFPKDKHYVLKRNGESFVEENGNVSCIYRNKNNIENQRHRLKEDISDCLKELRLYSSFDVFEHEGSNDGNSTQNSDNSDDTQNIDNGDDGEDLQNLNGAEDDEGVYPDFKRESKKDGHSHKHDLLLKYRYRKEHETQIEPNRLGGLDSLLPLADTDSSDLSNNDKNSLNNLSTGDVINKSNSKQKEDFGPRCDMHSSYFNLRDNLHKPYRGAYSPYYNHKFYAKKTADLIGDSVKDEKNAPKMTFRGNRKIRLKPKIYEHK